jgi:hypothetical protein
MANRHAHKKLRAEICARMTKTGESYQKARGCILSQRRLPKVRAALLAVTWYGLPVTLATYETDDLSGAILIPVHLERSPACRIMHRRT